MDNLQLLFHLRPGYDGFGHWRQHERNPLQDIGVLKAPEVSSDCSTMNILTANPLSTSKVEREQIPHVILPRFTSSDNIYETIDRLSPI